MSREATACDSPAPPAFRPGSAAAWFAATAIGLSLAAAGCGGTRSPDAGQPAQATTLEHKETAFMPKVQKSDEEWREQLTPEQFEVTRRAGTERPFTGEFWNHKEKGEYKCVCCGAPLFTSETKYDSGCGWPSFYAAGTPGNLRQLEDRKYGMVRTEVQCSNCGAHLGHVFDDGPQPTGQRYCMNSAAMKFEKKEGEE